jgi:hypothetical protein
VETDTKNLLLEAVEVSRAEVVPQISTFEELAEKIKGVKSTLRTDEEKDILKMASAIKNNLILINLTTAIRAGGQNPKGLPNLAVAPYRMSFEQERVYVERNSNGSVRYRDR